MNRHTKELYDRFVIQGNYVNAPIVNWMLTSGYYDYAKGRCSVEVSLSEALKGFIRNKFSRRYLEEDVLFVESFEFDGRFIKGPHGAYAVSYSKKLRSLNLARYTHQRDKIKIYKAWRSFKAMMHFNDSRKVYLSQHGWGKDHVYILSDIKNPNRVKIGVSKNIPTRIKQLDKEFDTSFFVLAVVPLASYPEEKILHQTFSDHHIEREFFLRTDSIERLIKQVVLSAGIREGSFYQELFPHLYTDEIPF